MSDLQYILAAGAGLGLLLTADGNRGAGLVSAACVVGLVALEIVKIWGGP